MGCAEEWLGRSLHRFPPNSWLRSNAFALLRTGFAPVRTESSLVGNVLFFKLGLLLLEMRSCLFEVEHTSIEARLLRGKALSVVL